MYDIYIYMYTYLLTYIYIFISYLIYVYLISIYFKLIDFCVYCWDPGSPLKPYIRLPQPHGFVATEPGGSDLSLAQRSSGRGHSEACNLGVSMMSIGGDVDKDFLGFVFPGYIYICNLPIG